MRLFGSVLLLSALCAGTARAQSPDYRPASAAAATLLLAPQNIAPPHVRTTEPDVLAERRFSSRAPGATLMIIGGASIVAGILVGGSGGTILILGGIGVGAYGLYLYTR